MKFIKNVNKKVKSEIFKDDVGLYIQMGRRASVGSFLSTICILLMIYLISVIVGDPIVISEYAGSVVPGVLIATISLYLIVPIVCVLMDIF